MQIFINDTPTDCKDGITISELLAEQNVQPVNVAVGMNDEVISKRLWDTTVVTPGSKIIIIKAVQGG